MRSLNTLCVGSAVRRRDTVGFSVGRHVVLELVGSGGMGDVYRAFDTELERPVALKVLRRRCADPAANLRLVREAQAMARLSHPNVVEVYDVGRRREGVCLTLEYVEGGTLADWLREHRSVAERLRVFLEAGRGLAAAHEAGIVHRDFKPNNVLVGHDGRVRVMDFGLALTDDDAPTEPSLEASWPGIEDSRMTARGWVVGTPAYMAPEQHIDRALDARSDQFSFCTSLFEALTGQRPFEGDSLRELYIAKRSGPSRQRIAGISRRLERAIRRGMSVLPGDRYDTMGPILAELEAALRPRRGTQLPMMVMALATALTSTFAATF